MKMLFFLFLFATAVSAFAQNTYYLSDSWLSTKNETMCKYSNGKIENAGVGGACKPFIQAWK